MGRATKIALKNFSKQNEDSVYLKEYEDISKVLANTHPRKD